MAAFSVLKQRVQYFAAQSGTTDTIDSYSFNDFIDVAVNRAIERMQRDHLWSDLWTEDKTTYDTTASTKTLSVASINPNYIESIVIEDTTNSIRPLWITRLDIDLDTPYPEGDSTDIPTSVVLRGRTTLEFYPIPDAAYDVWIYYYKFADTLSLAADTPDITNADDVIEAGAMVEICDAKELVESSMIWEAKYQKRLKERIRQDEKHPEMILTPRMYRGAQVPPGNYWAKPFYLGGFPE